MRFHPFQPTPRPALLSACPFCDGQAARTGRQCNICRRAAQKGAA